MRPITYTSKQDLLDAITQAIEAGDAKAEDFDLDGIAREAFTFDPAIQAFTQTVDADEFWGIVVDHKNPAFTLETVVESPKLISGGHGAWTGPLSELIYDAHWEGTVLEMIDRGVISRGQWEDEDFDLGGFVGVMTLADVRSLADDPNARILH